MTALLSSIAFIACAGLATDQTPALQRVASQVVVDSNAHVRHGLVLPAIDDAFFDAELVGAWACDVAADLDVDTSVCSPYRAASAIERRRIDQRPLGGTGDENDITYGPWTLVEAKATASGGLKVILRQDVRVSGEAQTSPKQATAIGGGMSRREWAHLHLVVVDGQPALHSIVVVPSPPTATTTPKSMVPTSLVRLCQSPPTVGPRTAWRRSSSVEPEDIDGLLLFGLAPASMQPAILTGLAASWGLPCAFPATAVDVGIDAEHAAHIVPPLPPGLRRPPATTPSSSLLMAVADTVEGGWRAAPSTTTWRDTQRLVPACVPNEGAQWVPPACGVSSASLASSADPGPAMFDARRLGPPHIVDVERADDARGERWRVWLEARAMHGVRHQQLQEWRHQATDPQHPWRLDRVLTPPMRSAFSTERFIMQNPQLIALCAMPTTASADEAAHAAGTARGDVGAAILAAPEKTRRAMIEAMVFAQGIESCGWISKTPPK